ncbi:MAG: TonB-dependent receptor [Saprospiraceae bacterium]
MRLLLSGFALLLVTAVQSQSFSVTGTIVDPNGSALPGAFVAVQHPWGEEVKATVTNGKGSFQLDGIEPGGYRLQVSFLGYEPVTLQFSIKDQNLSMGALALQETAVNLESVEVREKAPTATMKEDTLQFNATAFKVMKDANAEDLVTKMPTVTMENGRVKAQGENITQVLVDGKPFFGNDPTAALRNLPAEVIDKIQIFDQASEQAQFSGIQDGNTTKTMNIVTKSGRNNGQFGKIYAGFGWPDYYQSGGNINIFDGDRRISLIGMSNNINVQNFSDDDLLGVMGSSGGRGRRFGGGRGRSGSSSDFLVNSQGGISRTTAVGLNYSDMWGKHVEVTGSYFFNSSNNLAEADLARQFLVEDGMGETYLENSTTDTRNTNHRSSWRLEATLDSANTLLFMPRFSWQGNAGSENALSSTGLGNDLINQSQNHFASDLTALQFSAGILWRHKMKKDRRTLSVNLTPGYNPKTGTSELTSLNEFYSPDPSSDTLDQVSTLDLASWTGSASIDYTEPLGKNDQLQFSYRGSFRQEESDKLTFDLNPVSEAYDLRNDQLSNLFSNDYWTHNAGIGYSYNQGRDLNLMIRANYQWAYLTNDQLLPTEARFTNTFRNVLPFAMLRWNLNKQENVRIFYRSNTDLPSIDQLQNVLNNQNPVQLSIGNPNLAQSVSHNLYLRYQKTDPAKSTVLYLMGGGGITNDAIVNATWLASSDDPIFEELDIPRGAQLTRPTNLDGAWNLRSFLAYGFPLLRQRINTNLDLNYNFQRRPGLLNDERNDSDNHVLGVGVTFSSNISDKIDFSLAGRPAINSTVNSLQGNGDNLFFSMNSRLKFNWQIWEGVVFRSDVSHQYNSGLADGFNQSFILWNLAIGKKLFKNERGEVALAVNDLLKQNRNISRSVTETYIEDSRTNALQQFVMLTFTYDLRNFNTGRKKTKEEREEDYRRFH